jgi:cell division protein FtsB
MGPWCSRPYWKLARPIFPVRSSKTPVPFAQAVQRALPIAILALAVVGAPLLIFEPAGLPRLRAMEKELRDVNGSNADLRRDVTRLRKQVKNLRDDPAAVERIARDELGLVRKSEIVFQFTTFRAAPPRQ